MLRVSGSVDYRRAWAVQRTLAAAVGESAQSGKDPRHTMLLLQHSPVYTVGLRSKEYTADEEARLRSLGADFVRSNRGGLITFHGPGQLTVYPILHLPHMSRTLKWYVCALERSVIRACRTLGVETHTSPYTGVWVSDTSKICAIGIQGRRVTTHGLALNCNTDLSWFERIVPCGLEGKDVTSLSRELGRLVTVEEVVPTFLEAFKEVFECQLEEDTTPWKLDQLESEGGG